MYYESLCIRAMLVIRGLEGFSIMGKGIRSSFLAMACSLIRDYSILPKQELHRSLEVGT